MGKHFAPPRIVCRSFSLDGHLTGLEIPVNHLLCPPPGQGPVADGVLENILEIS
jgi:hypothetical protein